MVPWSQCNIVFTCSEIPFHGPPLAQSTLIHHVLYLFDSSFSVKRTRIVNVLLPLFEFFFTVFKKATANIVWFLMRAWSMALCMIQGILGFEKNVYSPILTKLTIYQHMSEYVCFLNKSATCPFYLSTPCQLLMSKARSIWNIIPLVGPWEMMSFTWMCCLEKPIYVSHPIYQIKLYLLWEYSNISLFRCHLTDRLHAIFSWQNISVEDYNFIAVSKSRKSNNSPISKMIQIVVYE